MEIWKTIEGYPNYMVSNLGRVKSLNYGKEKLLKPGFNGRYYFVYFCKEGKQKNYKVHRLVAQAFIPNPNNLPEVNHIDENKTNNRVDNLEWCDRKYNINYGTRTEKTRKPILQFTKNGEFVKRWNSGMDIERELEFNSGNISSCCLGKLKTCCGYKWGFAEDYERIPFKVFDLEIYEKKKVA